MAGRTLYRRFLGVRAIEHVPSTAIANSPPIAGLRFAPTSETARNLSRFGLLFRPRSGGFNLLYRAMPEAANELVPEITRRMRFVFGVFGRRSLDGFDTGEEAKLPAFHFDNLTAAGAIKIVDESSLSVGQTVSGADRAELRPERFVIFEREAVGPAEYRFTPKADGGSTERFPPERRGGDVVATRVDLQGQRAYERRPGLAGVGAMTTYVDGELRRAGALGVVELYWDRHQSAVPDEIGLTYRISFKPAAA